MRKEISPYFKKTIKPTKLKQIILIGTDF